MASAIDFAQTTAYDLTPTAWRLPPAIWTVFTGLNKVHNIWRWYRRAELYRQPDNLFQLFTGHIVNMVIGDSLLLRVAAQSLLIATRLLECAQQQAIVTDTAYEWWVALKGNYPKPLSISWDNCKGFGLFSASTVYWWKISTLAIYHRVHRVALLTWNLCVESFKLSMAIMDVIDVFYWSPTVKNEAINESFINLSKWLDNLVNNKEELLSGLHSNQTLIEKLLASTPFSYTQLEAAVTKTLNTTEMIHTQVKNISQVGNGVFIDVGKRMLNGASIVMGLGAISA